MAKTSHEPERIIRLIKLAKLPGVRIGELCETEGISPSTFRRWRATYAEQGRWTDDDVWLAAIQMSEQPVAVDRILSTYDYLNHARPHADDALRVLERLERDGWLRRDGQGWSLARAWP